jgi:hypothetical protein
MREGKLIAAGHVPSSCTVEQSARGAKLCVINGLARSIRSRPDRADRRRRARRRVYQFDPTFTDQPKIANAASEFLIELFGEAGNTPEPPSASTPSP